MFVETAKFRPVGAAKRPDNGRKVERAVVENVVISRGTLWISHAQVVFYKQSVDFKPFEGGNEGPKALQRGKLDPLRRIDDKFLKELDEISGAHVWWTHMSDVGQDLDSSLTHAPDVVGSESACKSRPLLYVERVNLREKAVSGYGLGNAGDVHNGGLAHAKYGVVGERCNLVDEELLAELTPHEGRQLVHELERRRAVVLLLRVVSELCRLTHMRTEDDGQHTDAAVFAAQELCDFDECGTR